MKQRDAATDIFKGLLVFGMLYAHVVQLSGRYTDAPAAGALYFTVTFIDNVTFAGFLFCFGYAAWLAYFSRGFARSWRRMLVTAVKILVAFYLSGFASRMILDGQEFSWGRLVR